MRIELSYSEPHNRGKWFFLAAFVFACTLFWWLPSIIYRLLLNIDDPVRDRIILISVLALGCFTLAYLLPRSEKRLSFISDSLMDRCTDAAWKLTILLFVPALLLALQFSLYRSTVQYGTGQSIPLLDQAVLYTHLFFGFMFLGGARQEKDKRRTLIATMLLILPRLIVSLHWERFFLAHAILPIVLIAIARGWIQPTTKRMLQLGSLAILIVFVPALTRGEDLAGTNEVVEFFAHGSTLLLFQDNLDLDLNGRCPPLVVSMTAKVVPYRLLGVCVIDIWGMKSLPATLDRILAYNQPTSVDSITGPGSNYLMELYLSGGLAAVLFGSAVLGLTCRTFLVWAGRRSLFAGIWAECLTRALLAPRSNLGYVYEQIPTMALATVLFIVIVRIATLNENRMYKQISGQIVDI
jgi:O-antigen polysaccharide polymerase Wzy